MPIVRKQGNAFLSRRTCMASAPLFRYRIKRLIIELELSDVCVFPRAPVAQVPAAQYQLRSLHDLVVQRRSR